jgi:predicted nucleotidyltransferase
MTKPAAAEHLKKRIEERDALLDRAVALLQEDARVVAAWLFGSLGRGEEDALSDLDLWVVVSDPYARFVLAQRREYVRKLGEPLLILEAPQNAPQDGAYLLTLYGGQAGAYQVDWYWEPQSQARIPNNARLLFDRVGLPRSGLPALAAAPGPQSPEERGQAAADRALFFWAMIQITAKKIARRQPWGALGMTAMVRGTLGEVQRLVGAPDEPQPAEALPPVQPGEQLEHLRRMAREMEAITPQIVALGGSVPTEAIALVYRFFDLVEAILEEETGQ